MEVTVMKPENFISVIIFGLEVQQFLKLIDLKPEVNFRL